MTELPADWNAGSLGDFMVERASSVNPANFPDEEFELYSIPAHDQEGFEVLRGRDIGSNKRVVAPGEVMVSKIVPHIQRARIVGPRGHRRQIASTEWITFRSPAHDPRFFRYFLLSHEFHSQFMRTVSGVGGSLNRAQPARVKPIQIPIPPLHEQRQIVDILEDHLSRIDAAGAYLNLSTERLKAMQRAALARCRDGDLRPIADLTAIQGGIQKQQKRAPRDNPYPFLRVANVTPLGLDLNEVHKIELFDGELERIRLKAGDLLVVEGNGSASQIGRAALWDGSIEDCVHQNHLIRVRPRDGLLPEYLEAVWNSPQNRAILTEVASSSSGLHTLSVSKLKRLYIPVPSIERQRELLLEVESVRNAQRRLTKSVAAASARLGTLRRSLLAAAFTGCLTGSAADLSELGEMVTA